MSEVKKFTIGEFTFDTFHEYRDAQEDLKKIECINNELDIHDPEVAVRLYNLLREGKISFRSPIGEQFAEHITDIVAEHNVGLLEDKAVIDEAEGICASCSRAYSVNWCSWCSMLRMPMWLT